MKFLCHITVSDHDFTRITFAVLKVSDTTFIATPVQNNIPNLAISFPSLYLSKKGRKWEYAFENSREWLKTEMISEMLIKLDQKMKDHKKLRLTTIKIN